MLPYVLFGITASLIWLFRHAIAHIGNIQLKYYSRSILGKHKTNFRRVIDWLILGCFVGFVLLTSQDNKYFEENFTNLIFKLFVFNFRSSEIHNVLQIVPVTEKKATLELSSEFQHNTPSTSLRTHSHSHRLEQSRIEKYSVNVINYAVYSL